MVVDGDIVAAAQEERFTLFLKDMLIKKLKKVGGVKEIGERLLFAEHHFGHAASAFFPSPFEEAVVLTIDGVGEWATTTAAIGRGNKLSIEKELHAAELAIKADPVERTHQRNQWLASNIASLCAGAADEEDRD